MSNKRSVSIVILLLFFTLTVVGCSNVVSKDETSMKEIAEKYILAEYAGDLDTLKALTREKLKQEIQEGENPDFKGHSLEKINEYTVNQKDDNSIEVVVELYSKVQGKKDADIYFEHLLLKRFDDGWFITEANRDN